MKNYTLILVGIFISIIFNANSQILISQGGTVSVNNGDVFYDAGGAAGNDGNTSYTITLCPAVAGEMVSLDFTFFKTMFSGGSEDALFIYDGNTATGNNIGKLMGDYSIKTGSGSSPYGVGRGLANSADVNNIFRPTIFSATNATGCLTLSFVNGSASQYPGWVANVITYKPLTPGCAITLTASKTAICSGESVNLTASGALSSGAINNSFNGTIGTDWVGGPAATIVNNVCASPSLDGSQYLWMQNYAFPRSLESNNLNVALGGTISFEYRQAKFNSDASPCEAPDIAMSGTTNEGVFLQYSTDNGTNWTTIKYLFSNSLYSNSGTADAYNNGCGDYVTRWTKMTYAIPNGAKSAATKFRWIQPYGTSASTDNWGLDNVVIMAPKPTTITIKDAPTTGTVLGTSPTSPYVLSVSPTVTTTYEATISDGVTSCNATVTINVTPGPGAPTVSPVTYCQNATAVALTATPTAGNTLNWYGTNATGGVASTTAPTPSTATATTTTYYVSQVTAGGCESTRAAIVVTVNTTPVLTINTPAAVCSPSTVNITAAAVTTGSTGGGTLSYWTNAGASIALASPAAITTSGTYYIKSLLGTCSDVKSVVVTVNTTPVLSIHDPAAVCSPSTVDITAAAVTAGSTGAGTLSYWTNIGATTTLASPSVVNASGTYYIKSTLGSCTDIKPVTVTINTTPSLSIHNPAAVCSPSTIDITLAAITTGSTGGGTLSYWTNIGATTSLVSPTTINASGSYYIKSTLGSCSDVKAVVVTINTTPSLTISDPTAVCSPLTIDITAAAVTAGSTGGGTLSYWTDLACTIPLASSNAVATSGTYYIKSTLGSCTDVASVAVVINNCGCPLTIVTTNPAAVCSPTTVNLTQASVTAGSTGGGTLSYWTDAACTIALASPSAVASSGTYYIKGSNGACSDSKPVTVTINTTPSLSIHDPAAVCSPLTVDITLSAVTSGSTGGGTLTYWTNIGATTSLASPSAVATTGTYYIKSTLGSCFDIKAVNTTINTSPVLSITNPGAVCSPLTVDLTNANVTSGSTGGGTLSYWQDLAATSALGTPSAVTTSGTYYIKSTLGSCTDIKSVVVTVNTTPVLSIHNPTAVCSPLTIDLTLPAVTSGSTGAGTLSYWTDAGATIPLVASTAVPASGTYYIKSTLGLCLDIDPVTVTINTTPALTITNPAAVCIPGTVDITVSGVTTGSTGGGTLSYWNDLAASSSIATPTAISTSNTYYIKSLLGNCFDIKPVVVTISAAPVLAITNPSSVCSPLKVDITLSAVTNGSTGAGTLSYWNDAGATSSLVSPTQTLAGTYYIKSTVGSCSDIKPVVVSITTTPVLVITDPNPACPPATVDLTLAAVTAGSTGGGTLSYWANALGTVPLPSSNAIAASGTYYIKSSNGSCFDIKPVDVTLSAPVLNITDPSAVCSPLTIDLTAASIITGSTGINTITYWTDAACTASLLTPNAVTNSGTYYLKASNGACTVSQAVNATINTTPVLSIHNPNGVCFPSTVDLTAVAVTNGSTGGGTLTYWNDLGATSVLNSPSAIATSGTYYIKSTSNGCFDVKPVTATINTTPSLLISNPPAICEPATVNLTQAGITAGSLNLGINSYYSDIACTVPVATPTAIKISGTYYVKSLAGNCFDIKPITVTINPLPTVLIGATASGCAPLKVDLTDPTLTAGSTPGTTFNYWSDNLGTNPLATPTSVSNGTYYISGTLNGCKSAPSQVTVTIHPLPIADFNPTPDLISTLNPETHLKNNSVGADTYFWDFGDGKFSQEVSPYHIYPDKDTATFFPYLIATSQFGCVDTIIKKVKVYEELAYFIPNTFTPDEDNFNNTFQPVFVSGYDPYNFSMYIFNRWGELIFESHDAKIGWRGTYGSSLEIAKEGVYTWKINFNLKSDDRRKEITGHVNLIK